MLFLFDRKLNQNTFYFNWKGLKGFNFDTFLADYIYSVKDFLDKISTSQPSKLGYIKKKGNSGIYNIRLGVLARNCMVPLNHVIGSDHMINERLCTYEIVFLTVAVIFDCTSISLWLKIINCNIFIFKFFLYITKTNAQKKDPNIWTINRQWTTFQRRTDFREFLNCCCLFIWCKKLTNESH